MIYKYACFIEQHRLRSSFIPADIIDPREGVVRFSAYNRLNQYIENMTRYESRGAFAETYSAALQEMLARTEVLGEMLDTIELETNFGGSPRVRSSPVGAQRGL